MILEKDVTRLSNTSFNFCKGAVEYIHSSLDKSGTAYEVFEKVEICLKIPRAIGTTGIKFCIVNENLPIASYDAVWINSEKTYDVYSAAFLAKDLSPGIYFFYLEIDGIKKLYGVKEKNAIRFYENLSGDFFQLSICEFRHELTKEKYGGVIYHIFVDRFSRSEKETPKRNDAIYITDWDEDITEYPEYPGAFLRNNTFYGGNLYGVIEKLDYIKSLGVNIIYLSPIFEAYSNHKYDVGDYSKVDDCFGGEAALELLIQEAKKREISILLDGVFNHTGADSVYFNKFGKYSEDGAYQSKDSKYYEWYDFQNFPNKYTCWWGIDILPRINPEIKSCSDFIAGKSGIIEKYTAMGVDGFRLDVVDELSDSFVTKIRDAQTRVSSNTFLYGEVWEDASNKIAYGTRKQYYLGAELDGVMNYPLRKGIIEYLVNKTIEPIEYALYDVFPNMPKRIRDLSMNLLGTHDTERILTVLGGASAQGKTNSELREIRMNEEEYSTAKRRLKLAYTILATLPGLPTVFYGDEAGMQGYSDPFNRRTFPWNGIDEELIEHYTRIGELRRKNAVYKEGDLSVIQLNEKVLIFSRCDGKDKIITFANNSTEVIEMNLKSKTRDLISGRCAKKHLIPSESAVVFCLKNGNSFEYKLSKTALHK